MKGSMNTHLGNIVIDPEVIAQYAGSVAVECFGIVGMASVNVKDGLVKLLKKETITHGIQVNIVNNKLILDFHVVVKRIGVKPSSSCVAISNIAPSSALPSASTFCTQNFGIS